MNNNAEAIISKFGTQSALATLLGKGQSTIAHWAKTGIIPEKWHSTLIDLARDNNIELHVTDFRPTELPIIPAKPASNHGNPFYAEYRGTISFGDIEVSCYVLANGDRVISRTGAAEALTGIKAGGDFESYVSVQALQRHMPTDILDQLVEIELNHVYKTVRAMKAETFLDVCSAYVNAFRAGDLTTDRQKEIALQAAFILASCSKLGLIALIDEATGYQYVREDDALQVKLKLYLAEEMRKWEKTFPDELWKEFGRLTNWSGQSHQRPKYWGKLVNELVYSYLDPDVYEWLKLNQPEPRHGRNYHQWLSAQYGLKKLVEHLWMLVGMGSACKSMAELRRRMAEKYGRAPIQLTIFD